MKMAFVLFDGVTFLDFSGFYDVVYRLGQFEATTDFQWDICGPAAEISDELGLTVKIPKVLPDLAAYDLVFVPGGMGTRKLQYDEAFVDWLRGAKDAAYQISVCTGSLLFGAAGFLQGRKATTHPRAYDLLEPYCAEVLHTRIVQDGKVITAGGVSTSIDLGLYVVELLAGHEAAVSVKAQIDYPYEPQGIVRVN